jgi:hypothetical protein
MRATGHFMYDYLYCTGTIPQFFRLVGFLASYRPFVRVVRMPTPWRESEHSVFRRSIGLPLTNPNHEPLVEHKYRSVRLCPLPLRNGNLVSIRAIIFYVLPLRTVFFLKYQNADSNHGPVRVHK